MKILCLYNNDCALPLFQWLQEQGQETVLCCEKLDETWCRQQDFDLTVSYTYRYILTQNLLDALKGNVVNLHNSFLPYNRGAAPNIWSFVEGTPRGVTLHYMDAELDKGFVIMQKLVPGGVDEAVGADEVAGASKAQGMSDSVDAAATLASTYNALDAAAIDLFKEAFARYDEWPEMKFKPEGKGSYHSVKDTKPIQELIDSYDMPIKDFLRRVREAGF